MTFRIPLLTEQGNPTGRDRLLGALSASGGEEGESLEAFESAVAQLLGGNVEVVALESPSVATHLALLLTGVEAGDEVYGPAFIRSSAVQALREIEARLVAIDAEAQTWNADPDRLVTALTEAADEHRAPAAVIVSHLFGQPGNVASVIDAARAREVPVIEDATEALGARVRGHMAGTIADVGVTALAIPARPMPVEIGLLVLRDSRTSERARAFAGLRSGESQERREGWPPESRLSNLLAAVGAGQLTIEAGRLERCQHNRARYLEGLEPVQGIGLQQAAEGVEASGFLIAARVENALETDRDRLVRALGERSIESRALPAPVQAQRTGLDVRTVGGDVSRGLSRTALVLPSGSLLTESEVDEICAELAVRLAC